MKQRKKVISFILFIAMVLSLVASNNTAYARDFSEATIINKGYTAKTTIKTSVDKQYAYYKFEVPSTGMVTLDFHIEDVRYGYFYLFSSKDMDKAFESYYCSTDSDTKVGNKSASLSLSPGTYYIMYENTGSRSIDGEYKYVGGTISVTYKFNSYNINTNIDQDNNDSIPKAVNWDNAAIPTFTGAFTNQIEDDKDYYKITIDEESDYHMRFVSSKKFCISFYDESGKELKGYYSYYNDAYDLYISDKTLTISAGTYYVGVTSTSNKGYYTLTLERIIEEDANNGSSSDNSSSSNSDSTGSSNSTVTTPPAYQNEWINGKWYDENGAQSYSGTLMWKSNSTGWWVEDTAGWYPRNSWQKIDGIWYYFKSSGYMASSEYFNGYWFNSNGSLNETYFLSWKSNSTGWWVEDKSGWWPSNSWLKIDGSWYYFDGSGYMVTNRRIDGWWLGADGRFQ